VERGGVVTAPLCVGSRVPVFPVWDLAHSQTGFCENSISPSRTCTVSGKVTHFEPPYPGPMKGYGPTRLAAGVASLPSAAWSVRAAAFRCFGPRAYLRLSRRRP
jgi:hypothetical protein